MEYGIEGSMISLVENKEYYFSLHIKYATAIWRDAFQNFVSFTLKIPKMNNNKKICILYENI